MNKEKYTSLEIVILAFFLMNSFVSTIVINLFKGKESLEILISTIIAFGIGFIILKLFLNLFGRGINSKFAKILLVICAFSFAIYYIFNVSLVIKSVILPETSNTIIELMFLILATILAIKGSKSIAIASNLFFLIYIVVVLIGFCFNLFNVSPINLLPIKVTLANISFYELLILTLSPLFFLLIINKKDFIDFKDFKRKFSFSYFIFYIYLIIKILFILSILGIKYFNIVSSPEIEILKMINIFNFFERLEEILIINIFIENLVATSLAIFYISELIKEIFKLKKEVFIIIDIIIFLILTSISILPNSYLIISGTLFILINFLARKKEIT